MYKIKPIDFLYLFGVGLGKIFPEEVVEMEWGNTYGTKLAHLFKEHGKLDLKISLCGKYVRFTYDKIGESFHKHLGTCPQCRALRYQEVEKGYAR